MKFHRDASSAISLNV